MRPIRRSSLLLVTALVGVGLVVGGLIPPLVERSGGTSPDPGWSASATLFLAALLVAGFAWNMWQALHKKKRTVHAEHAMRMLAVAKACVYVGGVFAGIYAGFSIAFIDSVETTLGRGRVIHGGAAAGAALLLLIAALLLERACRIPGSDDEDDAPKGTTASAA